MGGDQDEAAAEVAAMQFAGGMPIARVAELWEKDACWVEEAIRQALLESIPRRDGGTKLSRSEARAMRRDEAMTAGPEQGALEFEEPLDQSADREVHTTADREVGATTAERIAA